MIGVAANTTDLRMAEEFFELFKTPWEVAVPGRKYRVVLSTNGCLENIEADVLLVYGSEEARTDRQAGIPVAQADGTVDVDWNGSTFPIYGRVAVFDAGVNACVLTWKGKTLSYSYRAGNRVVQRIGYDLFAEIGTLLTDGQPPSNASIPTLELHIALLRHLLLESNVSFVEIPPRPDGYEFICCLTHDVDFFGIRRHKFDRTLAGFVIRASIGTLIDFLRGRRPLSEAARNWMALASLPLVFLGLAADFWHPFDDYARTEDGRQSTFFLVPFKNRPGVAPDHTIKSARAVRYDVSEIKEDVKRVAARASEVAVHGIDAWRDANTGTAEMRQVIALTGAKTAGVRMHWLYFDRDSARRLEAAGFDYDSTCGYNEAVGYRAGTSQVFRLPGTEQLMELPLSIMDSALFFHDRMDLDRKDASQQCGRILANARRFCGTVVINWHDRSLVPERQWGGFYQQLLDEVGAGDRAWFATGGQAVDWFRWRRSIRFTARSAQTLSITAAGRPSVVPAALLSVHRPRHGASASTDAIRFDGREPVELAL